MYKTFKVILFAFNFALLVSCVTVDKAPINALSKEEVKQGWTLLWDGKSFDGWRGIYKDYFPKQGWIIENGELICLGEELPDSLRGGDIITIKQYGSFELKLEFKMAEKCNSGIKYFVSETLKSSPNHGLGLEYAILDNKNWPYDKLDYNRTCGSLYDMVRAPEIAVIKPYGQWNEARILIDGNHIIHWLNEIRTVDIEKNSPEYNTLLAESKYAAIVGWGDFTKGNILLQDEGSRIYFRNIKIREFQK